MNTTLAIRLAAASIGGMVVSAAIARIIGCPQFQISAAAFSFVLGLVVVLTDPNRSEW